MNKDTASGKNLLTSLFCNLFGHHYVVSKKVTKHIKEYKCVHCQRQVSTDVGGKLSILTPKMREINGVLADMYNKRQQRIKIVHNAA